MNVRKLRAPEDAAAFRAIRLEALADAPWAYGETLAEAEALGLDDFAARLQGGTVAGAFDDRQLAGIAAMWRDHGNGQHRAYVAGIYVRPDARGNGYARRMLDWLATEAMAAGIRQLELHVATENRPAIAAYLAAGFAEYGIVPRAILSEGRFLDEVLMVRFLDR
jgi:ribosomal protein S18 acetylase RimI-like enzyme